MPEYTYISHKVKKGETLYGISRQYTVEEHKILQANPEIKITPKGKGKYEIANLKEGQILRIPQKKKIGKRGVKAITGNTTPKAGIKEKYRVTEWYPGTPTEMKNPANVKWAVYYKEKGKYILKFKKEIGEFTFHEQAIGKDIKIVGYLYSPELDNDSALSVKVSPNQKPSLTSLTLYDVKKDKPLSQNAKLKLGQILYVVANTTGSVGKKIEFTLLKKEEKQGKTEYKTVTNTTEKVSTKGTATTAFPLNDYKLLVNPIKKHEYKVKAQLEEGNAKKDKPKQQPKKEESIIYKGTIFFKEGWNKFRETYKKMTTSEEPQIQKVSLYIPGNKSKVSYGEKLKLKIEGKNLKGQSIEYTVYEDDGPLKDELDSSIVQMKADVQELDIQLTKEMYKKGGTSWLELADGKHEIYVDVKLKGEILAKSTKIIEVDTSTIKMEPIPGNRAVMTGEDKKIENCLCKQYDLIWGAKVSCEFRKKVVKICKELWGESRKIDMANGLMAVMKVETSGTFSPSKIELKPTGKYRPNGQPKKDYRGLNREEILLLDENFSGAVGLIQFTSIAIQDLNKKYSISLTKRKLALMTNVEQLDYVEKYFRLFDRYKKVKSPEDIYLIVFAPIGVGKDDDYVLYDKDTTKKEYEWNESVDKKDGNNDGKIQRREILNRYYNSVKEGKGKKTTTFDCGVIPIKKEPKKESSSKWHDPVDNPRLTKYNWDGNVKPSSATYGWCRRYANGNKKYHSGVDFFAIPGKDKVYSCLKGNIHQVRYSASAGWIVRVKIQNVKDLLEQERKVNYKTQYTDELKGIDLKETDNVYFIYMHLQSVFFTEKDGINKTEVDAGTPLGYAGVSGSIANKGHAPHLHLEIATVLDAYKKGEGVRTNPARFVKLNSYNTKDQDNENKPHYHKGS